MRLADVQSQFAAARRTVIPSVWSAWVSACAPTYASAGFAPRHERLWAWFESLRAAQSAPPQVEIWGRGGAKSTTAALGAAYAGTTGRRAFVLYVCETQMQADRQLATIANVLERNGVQRSVNAYGVSRGWNMQLLRADGFSAMSIGLDTAARGARLDEHRPDLIIFDDIDGLHDSERTTAKKIETITQTLLPTGAPGLAVLFIQNMIHADSIAARLADGRADFLMGRAVHVEPAAHDLTYELVQDGDERRYAVTGGTPTWDGQGLAVIEHQINTWGLTAFEREALHRVLLGGGIWDYETDIVQTRITPDQMPPLVSKAVAIDPSGGGTNEAGIVGGGIDGRREPHLYVTDDWSTESSDPAVWANTAVRLCRKLGTKDIIAEGNYGGTMVRTIINQIDPTITVHLVFARVGKVARAEPAQHRYRQARVHHVGTHTRLEQQLTRWKPGMPSPGRFDAGVWLVTWFLVGPNRGEAYSADAY